MANTKVVVAGVLFLLFSVSYASDLVTSTTPEIQTEDKTPEIQTEEKKPEIQTEEKIPEFQTEEKTPEIPSSVLDLARPSVQIFKPDASSSYETSTLQASFIPVRIDFLNIDGPLREFKGDPHFRFFRRHHRLSQRLLDWETLGNEHQGMNEQQLPESGPIEVGAGTEPVGRVIQFRFGGRRMGFHRGGGCPMMNKMMKDLQEKNGIRLQFHGDLHEKKGEQEDYHHHYHYHHPRGDHDDDFKKKNDIMKWFNELLEQF